MILPISTKINLSQAMQIHLLLLQVLIHLFLLQSSCSASEEVSLHGFEPNQPNLNNPRKSLRDLEAVYQSRIHRISRRIRRRIHP
ncbi:hypothetical protein EV361DRAFT_57941 [Lentinula raphanica]|nr:hypothetical protein C8R42DRAFT_20068 [Lentinula raphanica]KAJ3977348.1 hypothetical protein EV361DRAFT_57941 [Lentinula raphanica]